jgi:hypothetical protein
MRSLVLWGRRWMRDDVIIVHAGEGVEIDRQLVGKRELPADDLYTRTERGAARRVGDREKQLAAALEDVLERIAWLDHSPLGSPKRATAF